VRALGSLGGALSLEGTPIGLSPDVPRRMIEHAHRQGEPLVLGEAWRQGAGVLADPYLREHKVKSALALPIRHQTRAIGVLYLENNLVPHTFTASRLRVLTLLSSQMAISLENSLLFGKLNQEIEVRRRAEARAQESVQARDEFLSIAAHELKTPLTSLTLALQVLAQETDRGGNAGQVQLAQVGERQARRLQDLIDDLLDVSRVRAGKLQLSYEDIDLVPLVQGVLDGFTSQLAEARCSASLRVTGGDAAEIPGRWNRARLEQVLVNLISNAVKFGRGKPIEIELGDSPNQVTITVIDHGIGIPPDRLPHIFERFERAVSTAHYGGLGLGLYIAREITVALGGSIRVDSQLGVGSTFVVTLPRRSDRARGFEASVRNKSTSVS
jgi:signal transduction histidine kinase